MILVVILLPIIIGVIFGFFVGLFFKKEYPTYVTNLILISTLLIASSVGFFFNNIVLPKPVLNFMLIGMAFSATFANLITEENLNKIMLSFNPILGISMMIVILNLGTPLDYSLVFGAGLYTVIYTCKINGKIQWCLLWSKDYQFS